MKAVTGKVIAREMLDVLENGLQVQTLADRPILMEQTPPPNHYVTGLFTTFIYLSFTLRLKEGKNEHQHIHGASGIKKKKKFRRVP